MELFAKIKAGLQKTASKLGHEIKRIVTGSPKLTGQSVEQLEHALLGADLGMAMTQQILAAVKKAYESQGSGGADVFAIATAEVERSLSSANAALRQQPGALTVVSIVGVNGTGKTTTLRAICGMCRVSGDIVLGGQKIAGENMPHFAITNECQFHHDASRNSESYAILHRSAL
mgnify:CR=1 FL=1